MYIRPMNSSYQGYCTALTYTLAPAFLLVITGGVAAPIEVRDAFQYFVIDHLFGRHPEPSAHDPHSLLSDEGLPLRCHPDPAQLPVDFLIMLDRSGSLRDGDFKMLRTSMIKLINQTIPSVAENSTRVALITFARHAKIEVNFNECRSKVCYKEKFEKVGGSGGITRIHEGFQAALQVFRQPEMGSRECSRKAVLVVTDGTENRAADVEELEGMGVEIFAFGVTDLIKEAQLGFIRDSRRQTHRYHMDNIKNLRRVIAQLTEATVQDEHLVEKEPVRKLAPIF